MKKIVAMVLCLVSVLLLVACEAQSVSNAKIDYGSSSLYSKEDMDSAIKRIKKEFAKWDGCELHSISYSSDEECNTENIAWLNDLADRPTNYTQCIMFKSDFHSPKQSEDAWNPDYEYKDWEWWLARTDNGNWHLLTWGY